MVRSLPAHGIWILGGKLLPGAPSTDPVAGRVVYWIGPSYRKYGVELESPHRHCLLLDRGALGEYLATLSREGQAVSAARLAMASGKHSRQQEERELDRYRARTRHLCISACPGRPRLDRIQTARRR